MTTMRLAERVNKITASQSLAMAARAKAMKAAGADVVSMSLNLCQSESLVFVPGMRQIHYST